MGKSGEKLSQLKRCRSTRFVAGRCAEVKGYDLWRFRKLE
jgi:hypothetical protein